MPYTVICRDGDRVLEEPEFETEQQAMDYAIIAKRTYDHAPVGAFNNSVSVVVKRGRGRPEGSTKSDDDPTKRNPHEITITNKAWSIAKEVGNASQYIESLILADAERHEWLNARAAKTPEEGLRRYVESGGTSGKANDPYTDREMGL